jgi:mannosyl-oligosaccharide alpha-1,2-mannosidase
MDWLGVGLTIVDGIDTLMIMGLDEEVAEARHWITNHLSLERPPLSVSAPAGC